jgi:cobalt/nickel transport system permease protein
LAAGESAIHRLDARVKLFLLIGFLVFVAIAQKRLALQLTCSFLLLIVLALGARLRILRLLRTSLAVVPFVGLFALIVFLAGDLRRASFILAKSYISALSVLLCMAVTALPELMSAARFFRSPVLVVEVAQLIYRYLFVLKEQARVMQTAFVARAGRPGRRALQASAGIVAVLFGRSYAKATMVHQAMSARGFSGVLPERSLKPLRAGDMGIALAGVAVLASLYFL